MGATVYVEDLSGHEGRGLKEQHRIDDLAHLAHALHGMQRREEGVVLGWVHGGLDDAR